MQPDLVAHTLRNVEEEWKAQAAVFADCSSTSADGNSLVHCSDAPTSFGKSCDLVVGAVVQGSNGDKKVTQEYMTDVCGQSAIKGWHQQKCHSLAAAIGNAMSADSYQNRYNFNSKKVCSGIWAEELKEEQARIAQEKAAREVEDKKAAEEEKAAKEAAEKQAAEDAARKKIEDAAREKEEAAAKAKEAASLVKQKKAEAVAVAKAAEEKMAEAAQAQKEHELAVAKAEASKSKTASAEVKKTEVVKPVEVKAAAAPKEAVKAVAVPVEKKAPAAPIETTKATEPAKAKVAEVKSAPAEGKAAAAAAKK
jgi:hypothetical protein